MHLDPITGLWKEDDNDYQVPTNELPDIFDDEKTTEEKHRAITFNGTCILSIRLQNHGEYLKWKELTHTTRKWEFIMQYPAILRAEYEFHNAMDVEIMTKKIVQLLQMGFDVYSASWKLEEKKDEET